MLQQHDLAEVIELVQFQTLDRSQHVELNFWRLFVPTTLSQWILLYKLYAQLSSGYSHMWKLLFRSSKYNPCISHICVTGDSLVIFECWADKIHIRRTYRMFTCSVAKLLMEKSHHQVSLQTRPCSQQHRKSESTLKLGSALGAWAGCSYTLVWLN